VRIQENPYEESEALLKVWNPVFQSEAGRDLPVHDMRRGNFRHTTSASPTDFRPWSDAGYGVFVHIDPGGGAIPYQENTVAWEGKVAEWV
jgi:hypothetical protein